VLDDGKNVTAVYDMNDGDIEERYGYSAFGAPVFMDGDFNVIDGSNYDWETLFCGYRYDSETGLYQVRYRYLHAELGRWLSRDPKVTAESNLFMYISNCPIDLIDPKGLFAEMDCNRCRSNTGTGRFGLMVCILYDSTTGTSTPPFTTNTGTNIGFPVPPGNYNIVPKPPEQMDPRNCYLPPADGSGRQVTGPGGTEFPVGTPSITGPQQGLQPGQISPNSPPDYRVHAPGLSKGCIATDQCQLVQQMMENNTNCLPLHLKEVCCKPNQAPPPPPPIRRALPVQ
jgi:RHS repeat-associated protein